MQHKAYTYNKLSEEYFLVLRIIYMSKNVSEKGDEKWGRFISLLGDKIRLRSWNRFRGGLDVKGNIHLSKRLKGKLLT